VRVSVRVSVHASMAVSVPVSVPVSVSVSVSDECLISVAQSHTHHTHVVSDALSHKLSTPRALFLETQQNINTNVHTHTQTRIVVAGWTESQDSSCG